MKNNHYKGVTSLKTRHAQFISSVTSKESETGIRSITSPNDLINGQSIDLAGCLGTAGSYGTLGTVGGTAGTFGCFGTYGCLTS